MDRPNQTGDRRFAVDSTAHLQFPGEQAPLTAVLSNLSELGLFAVSEITYPASTEFNFRISGGSQNHAITGRGRVAWRRQLAADADRPAGMGCEILRLTDGSRAALKQRLTQSGAAEISREPPLRQSLTQELKQQSIQDALSAQPVERPEYFRTMSGPPVRKQEENSSRTPLWVGGGVILLALVLYGLFASGLLRNPLATDSAKGPNTSNRAGSAPAVADPTPLRREPSAKTPATGAQPAQTLPAAVPPEGDQPATEPPDNASAALATGDSRSG